MLMVRALSIARAIAQVRYSGKPEIQNNGLSMLWVGTYRDCDCIQRPILSPVATVVSIYFYGVSGSKEASALWSLNGGE